MASGEGPWGGKGPFGRARFAPAKRAPKLVFWGENVCAAKVGGAARASLAWMLRGAAGLSSGSENSYGEVLSVGAIGASTTAAGPTASEVWGGRGPRVGPNRSHHRVQRLLLAWEEACLSLGVEDIQGVCGGAGSRHAEAIPLARSGWDAHVVVAAFVMASDVKVFGVFFPQDFQLGLCFAKVSGYVGFVGEGLRQHYVYCVYIRLCLGRKGFGFGKLLLSPVNRLLERRYLL